MKIISHRGYWKKKEEQNTELAFQRSLSSGFKIETDLRDRNGDLVISHDLPRQKFVEIEILEKIIRRFDNSKPLAINIKSDGLAKKVKDLLSQSNIKEYFVLQRH